jgi:ubiquinone/menaquinone biosynthesis C-methylase UbiE
MIDGITPFLDRASEYAAARPPYSNEVIALLKSRFGLGVIADIGSGTGVFTGQLLVAGAQVYAVEPNQAMRAEAETRFAGRAGFSSVDAPAEQLPFADGLLNGITCAQSFHWFDVEKVGPEFRRVTREDGWMAALWNELMPENEVSAVIKGHLRMAFDTYGRPIRQPGVLQAEGTLPKMLHGYEVARFAHLHQIPRGGVLALARSRSYWPNDAELEASLMEALPEGDLFELTYSTEVHFGRLYA